MLRFCTSISVLLALAILFSCNSDKNGNAWPTDEVNLNVSAADSYQFEIYLGEFGKSYEKARQLFNILNESENSLNANEIVNIKIKLAEALRSSGNYLEGIFFLNEVINHDPASRKNEVIGKAYDRKAAIYFELFIHNRDQVNFIDSTFKYAFKALDIARQTSDHQLEASTLNIIGATNLHTKDYRNAEKNLSEAYGVYIENSTEPDIALIANLSHVKYCLEEYNEALSFAESCFQMAAESNMSTFVLIGIELMSNTYEALGELTKSRELRERHKELASINYPVLEALMVKHLLHDYLQTRSVERISWLHSERMYLVRLSRILYGVLFSLAVMSLFFIAFLKQKQNTTRLQNELLTSAVKADKLLIENSELQIKKQEVESKMLKGELENKESALASKLLTISKQNEFLIHLLKQIKQINLKISSVAARNSFNEIIDLINTQVNEKNWDELETIYATGNSEFIKNLNQAHPDLTSNERRLCMLLQMNLSTKEISDITRQSCRAVEMARYRLRLKLNISRDENINTYLTRFS